jgi:hypothetical protein
MNLLPVAGLIYSTYKQTQAQETKHCYRHPTSSPVQQLWIHGYSSTSYIYFDKENVMYSMYLPVVVLPQCGPGIPYSKQQKDGTTRYRNVAMSTRQHLVLGNLAPLYICTAVEVAVG